MIASGEVTSEDVQDLTLPQEGSRSRKASSGRRSLDLNPDLRTEDLTRPCIHPCTKQTQPLNHRPHHHPFPHSDANMQPYNVVRNGIGWVPERAAVECGMRLDVSFIQTNSGDGRLVCATPGAKGRLAIDALLRVTNSSEMCKGDWR